jgi:hypothetical protein
MAGITLAVVYGLGEARVEEWISIPDMAKCHGAINAVGFTLCGLIGWSLALAQRPAIEPARQYNPAAQRLTAEVTRAV